jgi:hypothetical protein
MKCLFATGRLCLTAAVGATLIAMYFWGECQIQDFGKDDPAYTEVTVTANGC